jgi:predicted Zn-dependent peptidase
LQSLHSRLFRPEKIVISVIGSTSSEEAARVFGNALGKWEAPELDREPRFAALNPMKPASSCTIIVVPGPGLRDPKFAPWYVMINALARGKGSRVFRVARSRQGWSYSTGAIVRTETDATKAFIYASYADTSIEEAGKRTVTLRAELETALTKEEISRGREFSIGEYDAGASQHGGILSAFGQGARSEKERGFRLAWWELRGGGYRMDTGFTEALRSADDEAVRKAASKYLPLAQAHACSG